MLLRGDNGQVAADAHLGPTEISFSLNTGERTSVNRIDRKSGVITATIEGVGSMSGHCKKDGGAVPF